MDDLKPSKSFSFKFFLDFNNQYGHFFIGKKLLKSLDLRDHKLSMQKEVCVVEGGGGGEGEDFYRAHEIF